MSRETPDEVREFAVNCGWTHRDTTLGLLGFTPTWVSPNGRCDNLPDFLNDLNACFEALEHVAEWFEVGKSSDGFAAQVKLKTASIKMSVNSCSTPQAAIIRAVNAAAKGRPR